MPARELHHLPGSVMLSQLAVGLRDREAKVPERDIPAQNFIMGLSADASDALLDCDLWNFCDEQSNNHKNFLSTRLTIATFEGREVNKIIPLRDRLPKKFGRCGA